MTPLNQALRAGRPAPSASREDAVSVLLAGGGGALGSAVLELLLGSGHFTQVRVLSTRALTVAVRGLAPIVVDSFTEPPATPAAAPLAQSALIVFDRERHANGRELAFLRPRPEELVPLARWLRQHGVRDLIVVLPHTVAHLPEALKAGLADLDEQAVAALGFDHLVFVRSAQTAVRAGDARWLQRLADGMLAQMQLMIAAPNQPVRAAKVACFVVELAAQLPLSTPGTRIAPPELVWHAAQLRDPAALVQAWLAARELPVVDVPRLRL